jgi:uncharacterized membrane protein
MSRRWRCCDKVYKACLCPVFTLFYKQTPHKLHSAVSFNLESSIESSSHSPSNCSISVARGFESDMLLPALLLLTSGLVFAEGIQKRAVVSAPSAPSSEPYPLSPSSNTLTLTRRKSAKGYNPRSAAYLLYNHPSSEGISPSTHNTGLVALEIGEEFATNITFGTQTFVSIVDTGSSDTWIAESGFQCVNISTDAALPEADCAFGPTFTLDSTFTQIPDENFNITYGSGEFLTGIVGYEDVTIAGIQVRQEVALVNSAAWEGDGTTSGLTGFAYPAL